jgi:hypothetical protein
MLVVLVVAGCARTATPPVSPDVPAFSTPQKATERPIPGTCAEVATVEEISRILSNLVTGETLPVVGVPQQNIGRTARLDCYYGVPQGKPVTAASIWIGLAGYVDEQSARKRLANTVADERAAGATASDVPVGAGRGVLLRTTKWMLVTTRGRTTAVVTVIPALVRADHAGALLGQLADLALSPRGKN